MSNDDLIAITTEGATYEIWRSNRRWHWHRVAKNGEIVYANNVASRRSARRAVLTDMARLGETVLADEIE